MSPPEDLPPSGSFGGSIPPTPETTATADPAQLPRHIDSEGGDGTSTVKAKRQVACSLQKSPDPTKAAAPTGQVASGSQKPQPSMLTTTTVENMRKGGDGQIQEGAGDKAEPPLLARTIVGSAGLSPGAYTVSEDGDVSASARYDATTAEATLDQEKSNQDIESSEQPEQPIAVAVKDKPMAPVRPFHKMSPTEDLPPSLSSVGGSISPGPESIATADPAGLPRHVDSEGEDDTGMMVKTKHQVAPSLQKSPNPTKATTPTGQVASGSQKQQTSMPNTTVEKRRKGGGDEQLEVRTGDEAEPPLLARTPVGSAGLSPGAYTVSADGDVSASANVPSTVAAGGKAPTTSFHGQSRYDAIADATLDQENSTDQNVESSEQLERPNTVAVEEKRFAPACPFNKVIPPEDLPPSGSSVCGSIPPRPETISTTHPAGLAFHEDSDGRDGTSTVKAKHQDARSLQKSPDCPKVTEPMGQVSVVARCSQKQQLFMPTTTVEKRRKGGNGQLRGGAGDVSVVARCSQKQNPSVPTTNVKRRGKGGDRQLEVGAGDEAEPPLPAGAPVGSAGLLPGAYSVSADGAVSTAGNVPSTADVPSTVVAEGTAPTTSVHENSWLYTIAEGTLVPETSNQDPESPEQPVTFAVEDKPFATAMKDRRIQLCLAFVVLAFIGLGVGLGVGLSGGDSSDDDKTSKIKGGLDDIPTPSPSPTTSKKPTTSPSRSFAPTIQSWVQLGQIINNFSRRANFGYSVSMSDDGSRLVASAPHYRKTGDGKTTVRVYDYEEGEWVQVGSDLVGDALRDGFGMSVSVSGNKERVAVGAPFFGTGHVKVFELNQSGNWSLVGAPIFGNATGDFTGKSVSLSKNGSILAVGAHGYVDVYKYEDASGNWTQIGERLEGTNTDYFHIWNSVDLSRDGGTVAIGEHYHSNETGRVSVFGFQNNSWTQMGEDLYGDLPGDGFGNALSLSDNGATLAVGAKEHDGPGGEDSGHVRVFEYDAGESGWVQKGGDLEGMSAGDHFGRGISLSGDGNIIAVGAYREAVFVPDDIRENSGRVRVFEFVGNGWEQIGDNIDSLDKRAFWGYALSLSQDGRRIAIGAFKHTYNRGIPKKKIDNSGQVVMYEWTNP